MVWFIIFCLFVCFRLVEHSRLDFQDASGKTSSHIISSLPSFLAERLTLLRYFAQYMDENLTEGGDSLPLPTYRRCSFVHMKRWVRTPKAIIMQLDNNTLQVPEVFILFVSKKKGPIHPSIHPSAHRSLALSQPNRPCVLLRVQFTPLCIEFNRNVPLGLLLLCRSTSSKTTRK